MGSIPESPAKRQEKIVPSTYEQALTLLNEKDERIEQLETFIVQQGFTFHAEATELSTPQTDARECGKADSSTEGTNEDSGRTQYSLPEPNRGLSKATQRVQTTEKQLSATNQDLRCTPRDAQTGISRSQGTPRTLFELAIGLTSTLIDIVADRDAKVEVANEDAELKQTYVENLNEQLDHAYTTIDKYEREKIYEHELFSNPDLGSSEKLVLLASRNVVRELRADDDTSLTDFHLSNIASMTGLTTETIGKKLHRLDAVFGTVEYKPKKVYAGKDKEGKSLFVSDTKLAILPLADQPQAIQLPDAAPRHGGVREKKVCPQCGSDKIQRATHTSCLSCKHTLELTVHMVNEQQEGLEQSDTDALFMLNEAIENAVPSTNTEVPSVENQVCTCHHSSENHHDVIQEAHPAPVVALADIETSDYKPAWKCDCRDAYKGWYWSRSVKRWRCTGCHKDASETKTVLSC